MRDSEWIATLLRAGLLNGSFIPDIFFASGRNIISYLIEHGTISKEALDSYLKTKTRYHINEILIAVNGTLSKHQQDFLKMRMDHYVSLKVHLTEIEAAVEVEMAPFTLQVEQLNRIYGISTTASSAILAEIGVDMSHFKTAEHICSWAGLCPGNNESAGKRKTDLSAWYWRIKQKKEQKFVKNINCQSSILLPNYYFRSKVQDLLRQLTTFAL